MRINIFRRKEKVLGVAENRGGYDLPLGTSSGNSFLMLLIGLMTFLALLMLLSFFLLTAMTKNWSSGLENHVTIEVPAEDSFGAPLSKERRQARLARLESFLGTFPAVKSIHILKDEEIAELVSPWLGDNLLLDEAPLPGLISVELKPSATQDIKTLKNRITTVVDNARLDTHETWLNDLLRFTGALRLSSIILAIFVGLTTITAIASAIQSRMAEYHAEVELLHLMGASDRYIARQLQKHSFILATKGGVLGLVFGGLSVLVIKILSTDMQTALLPEFHLTTMHYTVFAALPLTAGLIALITAKETVMRILSKMP